MKKKKKRKAPPLRRYRRAALTEMLLIVLLSVLAAVIIARRTDSGTKVFVIREERIMATTPVHIITSAPQPTPEAEPEPTAWVRYPVELEDALQKHITELCRGTAVSPCVVIGIIATETGGTFDAALTGDGGNSVGLMQIYAGYHRERMERLGVFDLTDPYQNVAVGIDLLDELYGEGKGTEWVLMAYNGGAAYADRMTELGMVSDYAQKVVRFSECCLENAQVMAG